MIRVDKGYWWRLMKVDEGWWRLMKVDEGWWRLMKVDEGWWRLMKVDEVNRFDEVSKVNGTFRDSTAEVFC
jgi:hypothetical protein